MFSELYIDDLKRDSRLALIYLKWSFGQPTTDDDFLYIRERVRSEPNRLKEGPMALLSDLLESRLSLQAGVFSTYYRIPLERVTEEMFEIFVWAVWVSSPEVLAVTASQGYAFIQHISEIVKYHVWTVMVGKYLPFEHLSNNEFRQMFEHEWRNLMEYSGPLYDFWVVPRVSLDALVRYQKIDKGDQVIRNEVSSFLAHEAKAYPHLMKPVVPGFAERAFGLRMREIYRPLVDSTARKAIRTADGEVTQEYREAIHSMAWQAYDQAWNDFEFHYHKKKRPTGRLGFLGLAEDPQERAIMDSLLEQLGTSLRSKDLTPILFSCFTSDV